MSPATGTINLRTGFFPLAFFLFFVKPKLEIDGVEVPMAGWGTSTHVVEEGARRVVVFFHYLMWKRTGEASIQINVEPGRTISLSYRAPMLMTASGKLRQS